MKKNETLTSAEVCDLYKIWFPSLMGLLKSGAMPNYLNLSDPEIIKKYSIIQDNRSKYVWDKKVIMTHFSIMGESKELKSRIYHSDILKIKEVAFLYGVSLTTIKMWEIQGGTIPKSIDLSKKRNRKKYSITAKGVQWMWLKSDIMKHVEELHVELLTDI